MEKLKRYNQKLLAILGTLIIVAVSIAIIAALSSAIYLFVTNNFNQQREVSDGLVVNHARDSGNKSETLWHLTYDEPEPLDTMTGRFVIPVRHVRVNSLKKERELFTSGYSGGYSNSKYRYQTYHGGYNNFVLFDGKTGKRTVIFSKKAEFTEWTYLKIDSEEMLLFIGTDTDDNNDNVLNQQDFQKLFVYYLNDSNLKSYIFKGQTVKDVNPMRNTPFVSIKVFEKHESESKDRPSLSSSRNWILDVLSRKTSPMIPETMEKELKSNLK